MDIWVNILLSITYATIASIYIGFMWTRRHENFIQCRNPQILTISTLGTTFDSISQWSRLAFDSPMTFCHPSYLSGFSLFSLHAFPLMLRGFQYVILTNDKYRRKYSALISNVYVFKICMIFFGFHTILCEVFYWTLVHGSDQCVMTWDAIYLLFLLIVLILTTVKTSSLIPWSYDSYQVGRELKLCYLSWASWGLFSILYSVAMGFVDFLPWQAEPFILIAMNVSTFYFTMIKPLSTRKNRTGKSFTSKLRKDSMNTFSGHPRNSSSKVFVAPEKETPAIKSKKSKEEMATEEHKMDHSNTQLQILERMFGQDETSKQVHEFANKRFVPEITLFLNAVYEFQLEAAKEQLVPSELFQRYDKIMDEYVKQGSPYEINISSELRSKMLGFADTSRDFMLHLAAEQRSIFDEACSCMLDLFQANFQSEFAKMQMINSVLEPSRV